MTSHKRVAPPDDPARALLKGIVMDVSKEVVAYIERMYPQAVRATSATFRLSVRNCIHNEIMATLDAIRDLDEAGTLAWLDQRKKQRRKLKKMIDLTNDTDWEAARAKIAAAPEPHQAAMDALEPILHPTADQGDD